MDFNKQNIIIGMTRNSTLGPWRKG